MKTYLVEYGHIPTQQPGKVELIAANYVEALELFREMYNYQKHLLISCVEVQPESQDLNFGQALQHLKNGKRVARKGWNGKGMWVVLVKEDDFRSYPGQLLETAHPAYDLSLQPFFIIKGVDDRANTWVPSISDQLAEDWEVIE